MRTLVAKEVDNMFFMRVCVVVKLLKLWRLDDFRIFFFPSRLFLCVVMFRVFLRETSLRKEPEEEEEEEDAEEESARRGRTDKERERERERPKR